MADQRQLNLESEARRFLEINALLSHESAQWQHLHTLFEHLREAYPPQMKGGILGMGGGVETPPKLEDWVNQTARGQKPRPDFADMNKMYAEWQKHPNGPEAAYYRRWRYLIEQADEIARTTGAPAADGSGPGAMPPAVSGESGFVQPTDLAQTAPTPLGADGLRVSHASPPPQSPSYQNTSELQAIQLLPPPSGHKDKFDRLREAAGLVMAQQKAFYEHFTAMIQLFDQYPRGSEQLGDATRLVADIDWVAPDDYEKLRIRHDMLINQYQTLRERYQKYQQEAQNQKSLREDARLRTADLLIKQARGLWKQFNLRAEGDKGVSDHDHSLAEQVYNDLLLTLDAACDVEALDVHVNNHFDSAWMDPVAQVRAKEKQLRGCIASVEEPGFRDRQTGEIWRAKVAVYSGE